jgi:hypothetical protein
MKKTLALFLLIGFVGCADQTTAPDVTDSDILTPLFTPANNLGGFDYKLNIIGVPKDKSAEMDDNNGRRIFVRLNGGQPVCVTDDDWAAYQDLLGIPEGEQTENPYACSEEEWADALNGGRGKVTGGWDALDKVNKILLTPNEEGIFQVLDANATDRDGAEFTMPDDVATEYKVYARALGKPGGKAAITLCANETEETDDDVDGDGIADIETWCSINQAVLERTKGKPRSEDVTDELFTLTILVDNDDVKDTSLTMCLSNAGLINAPEDDDSATDDPLQIADVPVFHRCFEDYFWNYDNNGLKLLQLRFFQVPSV